LPIFNLKPFDFSSQPFYLLGLPFFCYFSRVRAVSWPPNPSFYISI
jgi:hypothetical protein